MAKYNEIKEGDILISPDGERALVSELRCVFVELDLGILGLYCPDEFNRLFSTWEIVR